VADLVAFRRYCLGDGLGCRPCGGRNKSAQPVVDFAGLGHPRRICAPTQRTFWPNIVKFHEVPSPGGEHGSNEFQLLVCLLILSESTLAQANRLRTVSEIKANNVKARWQETTENDGKPLTISITDGANGLVYSAKKAGVPWLTGNVSVCRSGGVQRLP
jgi:hypothetical protein